MKLRTLFLSIPFHLLMTTLCFAEEFDNIPKLIVKGEAFIQKEADQMEVNLGVVTRGKNSGDALTQNNQLMNQVITHLKEIGLDEKDYQTCQFHIQPIYHNQKSQKGDKEKALLWGYEVYNSIQVKTLKIELADKILSAAVQGGANQIHQISFSLHHPYMYRNEAIQAAAQQAISDANALASATGVKVKRILNLSLNHWQNLPTPYMANKSSGGAIEMVHDAIEPGKAEIHAVVNVVFEIGS